MVGTLRPVALMLAVVVAATAFFRCDLPASAAVAEPIFSSATDHQADHCQDIPSRCDDACEIARVVTQDVVDASATSTSTSTPQIILASEVPIEARAPVVMARINIPLPPDLRALTPVTLHTLSRT